MKLKHLITFFLLLSSRAGAVGWPSAVSVGGYHVCALDTAGVVCWGGNEYGQTNVPVLKSPTQVSAGATHTCALDAEGVKCWGDNSWGLTKVPKLKSPFMVGSGAGFSCALDANGVKCWGGSSFDMDDVPKLNSPRQLSVGYSHACALDAEGVKCWGGDVYSETIVSSLRSPIQVSAGGYLTCALGRWGVDCWGYESSKLYKQIPSLESPKEVSVGGGYVCALDAEGVKCWTAYWPLKVPPLKNPSQVSAGSATCAVDDEGTKCWGGDPRYGQDRTSEVGRDLVRSAIPVVTFARAEYLKAFPVLGPDITSKADYFRHLLVWPAISTMDSDFFVKTYLPGFKHKLKRFQNSLGYNGDIRKILDAEAHRKLALVSIQSALSVSLNFISLDEQSSIQNVIRTVGIAMAEPTNNKKIKDLLKQIDSLRAEKRKLKSYPKSAFLVDTLELAANWLREKVK